MSEKGELLRGSEHRVSRSDLGITRIGLAVMLRINCNGIEVETGDHLVDYVPNPGER